MSPPLLPEKGSHACLPFPAGVWCCAWSPKTPGTGRGINLQTASLCFRGLVPTLRSRRTPQAATAFNPRLCRLPRPWEAPPSSLNLSEVQVPAFAPQEGCAVRAGTS